MISQVSSIRAFNRKRPMVIPSYSFLLMLISGVSVAWCVRIDFACPSLSEVSSRSREINEGKWRLFPTPRLTGNDNFIFSI